jgi:hypothetical protein
VIDTLALARRKHAGGLTLDDLCTRYGGAALLRNVSYRDDGKFTGLE